MERTNKRKKKKTSIGNSTATRYNGKQERRSKKKYKGQGKCR